MRASVESLTTRPFTLTRPICALMVALAIATGAPVAAAETPIKFSLESKFEGPAAPFLVPLDRGYYKAESLNVSIDSGPGSIESISRVASGLYDMGFADINALIKFRDAHPDMPVKAVFMVYNKPPFAIVGRKSRGVTMPKDLQGKKLGAPPLDGAAAQWPIFADANGIDTAKVKIETIGVPVREPMLAAGQVDAITGSSFSSYINLKERGVAVADISVLLMADYGVNLYGSAIIVNPKFAADHAVAIQGFLKAFLKGLKDTLKDPPAAVEVVLKRDELVGKATELERLTMALRDNITTAETRAKGYGDVDEVRLAKAIDQIGQAYKWRNTKPTPTDIFDAAYLPPDSDRKF